ncbi:MAG: hypothetical protein AAFV62_06515 [Pseudomonadota bacterium]
MSRPVPLPRDWTSTWLSLVVSAAMGFLASLGVVVLLGAESLARSWTTDLASRATVSLFIAPDDTATLDRALAVIRETEGVGTARAISEEEIAVLLSPWLGDDPVTVQDLPLPRLIDIRLAEGSELPVAALSTRLADARIEAEVDAHGRWIDRLRPAAERVRALAVTALVILGVTAALVVALACSAGLAAQSKVVDVLKLIGAQDRYISRVFVRRFQWLVSVGAALGVGAALMALLWATLGDPEAPVAVVAPLLPELTPSPRMAMMLGAIPILLAGIASVAARLSVRMTLRRREG